MSGVTQPMNLAASKRADSLVQILPLPSWKDLDLHQRSPVDEILDRSL